MPDTQVLPETVRAYPPDAILTPGQVAEWLQISTRTLARLPIPSALIARDRRRYIAKHVLEFLEMRLDSRVKVG